MLMSGILGDHFLPYSFSLFYVDGCFVGLYTTCMHSLQRTEEGPLPLYKLLAGVTSGTIEES